MSPRAKHRREPRRLPRKSESLLEDRHEHRVLERRDSYTRSGTQAARGYDMASLVAERSGLSPVQLNSSELKIDLKRDCLQARAR